MIGGDWATGAYRDIRVAAMDVVMGRLDSGDPSEDSLHQILYYLISSFI